VTVIVVVVDTVTSATAGEVAEMAKSWNLKIEVMLWASRELVPVMVNV